MIEEVKRLKLSRTDALRLDELTIRVAENRALPKDVKHLRNHIYEMRLRVPRGAVRVLYARIEGGVVILCLRAFLKKTPKTPPEEIDRAEKRLRKWQKETE